MSKTPRLISVQCAWTSTMPGMIVAPLRSMTFAPEGTETAPRLPTAAMRLSVTTMSESGMTSSPRMVMTLAPRNTTVPVGLWRGTSISTANSSYLGFLSAAGFVSAVLSSLLVSESPALSGVSNETEATGWRKNDDPNDHVMVLPSSAQAKESAPMSVSFFRGTDGELTFTVGPSPPVIGTSSRYN